jgi:cyclophilin family peptidyl-prolyl cis-trans isomerase
MYINSGNPYQKAGLLSALQHSAAAFIQEQFFSTDIPVVKLAAATSIVSLNHHKAFDSPALKDFSTFYINAIGDGDPAAIGIITSALTDPELGYKNIISDYSFLQTAADKMSLPRDYEALQPLLDAIAYFEDREPTSLLQNGYNHPIDWALVRQIPATQQAVITTTKGAITMQLFVEEAPGSVGNFVALVRQQYFNGKYFHRVVPNFVVQTGCNRGDGWGSEDYSIRSEFSLRRYKTGSVGMASAGKDTEGTQWFITHSPTPHLDGRYSLFAEVTSGLDVLDQIEVGDKIINIELK